MQGNDLHAQEILSRRDAIGQIEVSPAVVLEQVIDTPFPATGFEAILPNLEPLLAGRTGRCRVVVDFSKIGDNRSLVGLRDWIVLIIWKLGAANNMSPESPQSVARCDVYHGLGLGARSSACHVAAAHILNGIVVSRCADARELTVVFAVDREFLQAHLSVLRPVSRKRECLVHAYLEDGMCIHCQPVRDER